MSNSGAHFLLRLDELLEKADRCGAHFLQEYNGEIEAYRQEISVGIDEALAGLEGDIGAISDGNLVCVELARQTTEYVSWMKWALWDLPYFAVATGQPRDVFRALVTACGLVYLSIRIFDDVIDHHFWYKGRHTTVLGETAALSGNGKAETGLAFLAGLLVCFEGFARLSASNSLAPAPMLPKVLDAVRRAVIGAIMEHTPVPEWSFDYYERMVGLKNVAYWEALYTALDPDLSSPLYPFLQRYYALAQHLNDVQDFDEDQQSGQPNLLSLYLANRDSANGAGACPPYTETVQIAPAGAETKLATQFEELGDLAEQLPEPERSIAYFKLAQSLRSAKTLGLFAAAEPALEIAAAEPQLYWYSDLNSVLAHGGAGALEEVGCNVCGGQERHTMFLKNGFAYHRCADCTHIYVSPRASAAMRSQMRDELDLFSAEDSYLEVQRFHAEWLCVLLRHRSPGARLLDIGCGRGYLLRLAQAHGFEVYGLDSSRRQIEGLAPIFGQRVARVVVGEEQIPWQGFDVITVSHVLEHLAEPGAVLNEVRGLLDRDGILFIAVPDIDSVQFKLFGKRWDVVNPLAHLQYFNEASLTRLLEQCGFTKLERVRYPALSEEQLPRWARLMRQLNGSESNELMMVAHATL